MFIKFYLYCKRNFVQDLAFVVSPEHLFEIVEQYKQGRASSRTAIEVQLMVKARKKVLSDLEAKMQELVREDASKWETANLEF